MAIDQGLVIDDTTLEIPVISEACLNCANLSTTGERSCTAFDFIPDAIWYGRNDHTKPFPDDQGIQFTPYKRQTA